MILLTPYHLGEQTQGQVVGAFDSPLPRLYVPDVAIAQRNRLAVRPTFAKAYRRERIHRLSQEPWCPHYPNCFACPLIHLPYDEQLVRKRQRIIEAFGNYPTLAGVEVPVVVASPRRLGYRSRVKLVVRKSKGGIAAGLYVPQTHRVIDISSCPVHPRPVNQVLGYLKRKIEVLGIAPYDERNDTGQLRYLDFRYSFARRELGVTLVTRHSRFPEARELARSLTRRFPFIAGVIQNVNERHGNVIWGDHFRSIAGHNLIVDRIGSFQIGFPAGVFSQANPFTASKLYKKVVELAALTGREVALDLYCGVGPLSIHLAVGAGSLWGIDDHWLSVARARQNALRNGISNCRFELGDVAEKANEARRQLQRIDLVVANPPRKGLQRAAMEAMLKVNAPRIIYVSCDPLSLARDLERLVEAGYAVHSVQPFDMFPQTEEIETVTLLEKR